MVMCWQAARDQAVVGDHAGWINGQTIDAVAGERGDDVHSAAEAVGGAGTCCCRSNASNSAARRAASASAASSTWMLMSPPTMTGPLCSTSDSSSVVSSSKKALVTRADPGQYIVSIVTDSPSADRRTHSPSNVDSGGRSTLVCVNWRRWNTAMPPWPGSVSRMASTAV